MRSSNIWFREAAAESLSPTHSSYFMDTSGSIIECSCGHNSCSSCNLTYMWIYLLENFVEKKLSFRFKLDLFNFWFVTMFRIPKETGFFTAKKVTLIYHLNLNVTTNDASFEFSLFIQKDRFFKHLKWK